MMNFSLKKKTVSGKSSQSATKFFAGDDDDDNRASKRKKHLLQLEDEEDSHDVSNSKKEEAVEEEDALEEFMSNLKEDSKLSTPNNPQAKSGGQRLDLETPDEHETYIQMMQDKGIKVGSSHLGREEILSKRKENEADADAEDNAYDDYEFDLDEEAQAKRDKKFIKGLNAIDHKQVEYLPFKRCFYGGPLLDIATHETVGMEEEFEGGDDNEEDFDEDENENDENDYNEEDHVQVDIERVSDGKSDLLVKFGNFLKVKCKRSSAIPKLPSKSFDELITNLDKKALFKSATAESSIILNALKEKMNLSEPTLIQSLTIPCALLGNDLIVASPTGSGKTLAYLLPILFHILANGTEEGGFRALILAPTRELVQQIANVAFSLFSALVNCSAGKSNRFKHMCCVPIFGGASKMEQFKRLRSEGEAKQMIVVSTPGRFIDMVKMKAVWLEQVSMLVLDEADRMLQLGFEEQVKSICQRIRPDRQTLLFSATFPDQVHSLLDQILYNEGSSSNPLLISLSSGDGQTLLPSGLSFNPLIVQRFVILEGNEYKWSWLMKMLPTFLHNPDPRAKDNQRSVIIFVTRIEAVLQLSNSLLTSNIPCLTLHGDMNQNDRSLAVKQFSNGNCKLLVATDVAGRGLDIPEVQTVINYDIPRDIESYVHRIGRTGRKQTADDSSSSVALTLLVRNGMGNENSWFAGQLLLLLESNGLAVPADLRKLAFKSSKFKRQYFNGNNSARNSSSKQWRGGKRSKRVQK